jgi:hypothetical protein
VRVDPHEHCFLINLDHLADFKLHPLPGIQKLLRPSADTLNAMHGRRESGSVRLPLDLGMQDRCVSVEIG